jgi:diguanylate cyclase (GGDEF)-like protein
MRWVVARPPVRTADAVARASARRSGSAHRWAAAGVLLVVVVVGVFGAVATKRLSAATASARTATALTDLYQDARYQATAADALYQEYVGGRADAPEGSVNAIQDLNATLQLLGGAAGVDQAAVRGLQAVTDRFSAATARAEALSRQGHVAQAAKVDIDEVEPLWADLLQMLNNREEQAHRASKDHLAAAAAEARWIGRSTPIVIGGSLLVAVLLSSILRRDRRRIELLATTDALTGLPNRLQLARRAAALLPHRSGGSEAPALLVLDLDRFKEVNDSLGHHFGDALLVQVGHRLEATIQRGDMVARLGGDEFAVLLAGGGERAARTVAARIHDALTQPFTLDHITVEVGVSAGIAVAASDVPDLPALLRRADVAMYVAKEGNEGSVVFTADHDKAISDHVLILSELRRALDHDQLVLHYQPKVDLVEGLLFGVEALVRWQHPTRGLLPPAAFLPARENTDLMDRLTTQVLTKALSQCRSWIELGRRIPIAVNIPTRSLLSMEFAALVADMLSRAGVPADLLCLEITESSAMRDPARCIQVLHDLRALGVKISIDDYGTGYASMSYLQNLPIDEVKIDRSFIGRMADDPQSAILVRAMVELGHNLGLTVVGEGVEDVTVGTLLRDTGCDVAQGYHYARPMPAEDIVGWQHLPLPRVAVA